MSSNNIEIKKEQFDLSIFKNNGPFLSEIIEIKGQKCCGKSNLLNYLIAKIILPKNYGGKGRGVIYINADTNFDIIHFVNLLKSFIELTSAASLSQEQSDFILQDSLRNLFIISIIKYSDFNDIILLIHQLLQKHSNIATLAIDSINYFFINFQDNPNYFYRNHLYLQNHMRNFKKICEIYRIILIYTIISDFKPLMYLNYDFGIDYKIEIIKYFEKLYARINYLYLPTLIEFKTIFFGDKGLKWWKFLDCDDSMDIRLKEYWNELEEERKMKAIKRK